MLFSERVNLHAFYALHRSNTSNDRHISFVCVHACHMHAGYILFDKVIGKLSRKLPTGMFCSDCYVSEILSWLHNPVSTIVCRCHCRISELEDRQASHDRQLSIMRVRVHYLEDENRNLQERILFVMKQKQTLARLLEDYHTDRDTKVGGHDTVDVAQLHG